MAGTFSREKNVLEQIMRSADAGRIVHAMIFTGQKGTGKTEAAKRLASFLLCTEKDRPCGKCAACVRVREEMHPDLKIVRPESGKSSISIAQVRDIVEYTALKPFEGGRRVIIIEGADLMTEAAQNALLKTLEEASSTDYFILTAAHNSSLLPTIRSRARIVRFHPMETEECIQVLTDEGAQREDAVYASFIAMGAAGRAREILADAKSAYATACDILTRLSERDIKGAVSLFPAQEDKRELILQCLYVWGRDRMLYQNHCGETVSPTVSRVDSIHIDGQDLLGAIAELRDRIASNMSWQNAIDSICLKLTEGHIIWQQ